MITNSLITPPYPQVAIRQGAGPAGKLPAAAGGASFADVLDYWASKGL